MLSLGPHLFVCLFFGVIKTHSNTICVRFFSYFLYEKAIKVVDRYLFVILPLEWHYNMTQCQGVKETLSSGSFVPRSMLRSLSKCPNIPASYPQWSRGSSRKVSHEWLATL